MSSRRLAACLLARKHSAARSSRQVLEQTASYTHCRSMKRGLCDPRSAQEANGGASPASRSTRTPPRQPGVELVRSLVRRHPEPWSYMNARHQRRALLRAAGCADVPCASLCPPVDTAKISRALEDKKRVTCEPQTSTRVHRHVELNAILHWALREERCRASCQDDNFARTSRRGVAAWAY